MPDYATAQPGHLYLIGVGPGAPDLLTLRAVNIIGAADVIVAPRSSTSQSSLALDVVRPHLRGQEVIEHIYPMARDQEQTSHCWGKMADLCVERLHRGQSVAHITLGDPLIYSTCAYLLEEIGDRLAPSNIHLVSGISAMQGAAARLSCMLLTQNDRLTLLPADDLAALGEAIEHCETLVIYKIAHRFDAVVNLLRDRGLLSSASLVCYAEQQSEQIFRSLDEVPDERLGYMSIMIVRVGHRSWR